MSAPIALSQLGHTWLVDIDGTLVKHNGHKHGADVLLPGVYEFWKKIPEEDVIVLLSARKENECAPTLDALRKLGIRFDHVIFGLPTGERLLINDAKPSGLKTAISVSLHRDVGFGSIDFYIDNKL